MKLGKLPEAIEKRAILRVLNLSGMEPQKVSRQLQPDGSVMVLAGDGIVLECSCQAAFLADRVLNMLAAEGVDSPLVTAQLTVPESYRDEQLRQQVKMLKGLFLDRGVEMLTVQARVCRDNDTEKAAAVLYLTGCGICREREAVTISAEAFVLNKQEKKQKGTAIKPTDEEFSSERYHRGSIIMIGYAALEATACMIEARQEELKTRLSEQYLSAGMRAAMQDDLREAIRIAAGEHAILKLAGEGGIFTALWELGSYLDCGMKIRLRDIPLRQETIEVCEVLDINPYLAFSTDCMLAVTNQPKELRKALQAVTLPAVVIGELEEGSSRVLVNGEEQRFLEPFRGDELYKAGILKY